MSKLERLLNLLAALLHTPVPLTAEQIRARLEGYSEVDASFRRAFERDKDDLRSMGVPIRVEPVAGTDPPLDGYRIDPSEYGGSDPQLEPDELAALHLATGLVRVDGVSGDQALVRVGGVVGEAKGDQVAALPTDPNLGPLFEAISSSHSVTFDYRGTERLLDPFKLSFSRGHWYLTGYDHSRDDERQFRVDRIVGSVVRGAAITTERPTSRSLDRVESWAIGDEEPVLTRLLVDADQAAWAKHYLGNDAIAASHTDGSVEFELLVRNREAFRSFVLTFLDHAELLSPEDLRNDLVGWLEALLS
ncbi:MAG: WYL domain-containing protein [Acidimicrobiales bacterium]